MQLSDSLQLAAAWFRVLDAEQQARVERDLSVQQVAAGSREKQYKHKENKKK